jgi:hypothetical protein
VKLDPTGNSFEPSLTGFLVIPPGRAPIENYLFESLPSLFLIQMEHGEHASDHDPEHHYHYAGNAQDVG